MSLMDGFTQYNETALKAAIVIQAWYRRYKARLEARRRAAWTVYECIEYSSESGQVQLHKFLADLTHLSGSKDSTVSLGAVKRIREFGSKEEKALLKDTSFEDIAVEKSYSGPHLSFPLGAAQVQLMIDSFRQGHQLHPRYLLQLLHETRLSLKSKSNIHLVTSNISKQVTVIGDLHGQLDDLLMVFSKNGLPDVTNPYVFNGDFVDRGPNSTEVMALLFACMLAWPTAVFLNRGNHEDHKICDRYGFTDELMKKYGRYGARVTTLFFDIFSWLPLATIIDETIFVAHGGISDTLDLRLLRRMQRDRFVSVMQHLMAVNSASQAQKQELDQVMALLWSDPANERGCRINQHRGGGYCFGPDVTAQFLRRNGLAMIVRSHECKPDGFEFNHNRSVLTIFSASNYYSEMNKGAYVKFNSAGQPHIVQFSSSTPAAKLSMGRRVAGAEEGALRVVRSRVAGSRTALFEAFRRFDPNKTGSVSLSEWACVMKAVLQLDLPWRMLRPHLAELSRPGRVLYASTFDHAALQFNKADSAVGSVTEILYRNREELETIFRIMDRDGSGHVTLDEFRDSCRVICQLTQQQMTLEDMTRMARMMDLNKDGSIDYNEFLEAFRIVDPKPDNQPGHKSK